MDRKERVDDELASLRAALRGWQVGMWTALPGVIESFDDVALTCVVQPAIKIPVRANDGTVTTAALPPVVDCPVQFPSGGNCTLTFPVAQGDECLVVFASRCIDAWWQSGGVQEQAEWRMHDLSDGFALLGFRSKPRALSGVSATSAQLRSDDGATYIDLNPAAGTLKLVAPGGLEIDAPTVKVNAGTSVEVNSPQSTFDGALTVKGVFTFLAGLVGSAAEGVAATITGTINFIGTLTSNGKRIDDSHTHSDPQGGNTGPVN
ncbi:phage baseplate assembly protein V [Burkholderia contaminans]|uniref:phage baseplate assembly protein V n=1 Tax=Burkholderia contaminans TaxID=488447 RepID=UPI000F55E46F|nr:phage baseplate assembly protein V [Burkholderia contaminans]RQT08957.1 phage baseplate assembly protein V [Burkholderia contaminans]